MGSTVTDTVRSKIADVAAYESEPEVLMYGMMCVLLSVGIWLMAATKMGLPVSTTHSTVGGVIGMSLVARGASSVNWGGEVSSEFPYLGGVSKIVLSWIFSPVLSGMSAALLFVVLRGAVLRTSKPFRNSLLAFPFVVGCTITINVYFLLVKGLQRANTGNWSSEKLVGVSFGVGLGATIMVGCAMPALMNRINVLAEREKARAAEEGSGRGEGEGGNRGGEGSKRGEERSDAQDEQSIFLKFSDALDFSTDDVVKSSGTVVQAIHDNAEVFDSHAESVFGYMQVFSACCDSFAHGANDVANAMGPFAAIWSIYEHGYSKKADVPEWILVVGGLGIVAGLVCYGAEIIKQIGMRLSKITPSRGLCIELGAAIVIIVGTKFGIPLSTTHCQVGATTGVALLEGKAGVNWGLFAQVIAGWIMTIFIAAAGAAMFTAQGLYAPHIHRYGSEEGYAMGVATCAPPPPPPY